MHKELKLFSYGTSLILLVFLIRIMVLEMEVLLKTGLYKNLKKNNIDTDDIQIKLLCYPRIFGYVFNPLSVFYIYDKKSEFNINSYMKLKIHLENSMFTFLKLKKIKI